MNDKIKISDFFVQLQQIDIGNILLLISPTIVYFATKEPIKSNYKLRKDFKIGSITTAALPIDVIRKFDDIDEEEILKKQFGTLIMEFVKTVRENISDISDINLSIFLNNLNTLGTSIKSFKLSNFIFKGGTAGQYRPINNTIELSENNYNLTINHELFHASTTVIDEASGIIYCGFQQILDKKKQIGEGLNEGYTQYLAEKYFGTENSLIGAYVYEKKIAEALETIVGKEQMQSLYFNANLNGLIEYLKKYSTETEIYKFINTLDFLNGHMNDKYLISSSKEIIINSFRVINSFLIKTSLRKNIIENTDTQLTAEDLAKKAIAILEFIPNSIKLKNKSFQISDDKLVIDEVASVLSEFEWNEDMTKITK